MQSTHPNGRARAPDAAESDINTMFDEIMSGFGDSDLALDDPRGRAELAHRGHRTDDSIVSLISSYEGDGDDSPRPTLANTYSSQRPAQRTGERLRPLPQVPGAPKPFTAPAPPPPLPSSVSMPSPEPFQHPPSPGAPGPASAYLNSSAYISPGPANALLNAHPRRQLPSQPETFGMPAGIGPRWDEKSPLGPEPGRRQNSRRPNTAGSDSLPSPVNSQTMSPRLSAPTPAPYSIPTVQVGGPDEYQPSFPAGPPPGAMMPSTPGTSANLASSGMGYRTSSPQPGYEPYGSNPPYVPPTSNSYPSGIHPPPRTTSRMPSSDLYGSSQMATLSPHSGATLGRSGSASSSLYTGAPISRTSSLAAGPANSSPDTAYFPQASVDRANSKSSNWSANSNLHPSGNNYPASTISYETNNANNDGVGYLDLPSTASPVAGPSFRPDQQYLEERIATAKGRLELHEDDEEYDYSDEDEAMFVNLALLSHLAVKLRDKVPRGTHVKGSIPYSMAFTGKDIVSTIQATIQRQLAITFNISTNDRRTALQVARSLQNQLFFYEVEWGGQALNDGVEDVYMFLDDQGGSDQRLEREELPTGVITLLTSCYSPSCADGLPGKCYAYGCPRGYQASAALGRQLSAQESKPAAKESTAEWVDSVDPEVVKNLPESERRRQEVIFQVVKKEEQYVQDLDAIVEIFIRPLREARPPIIQKDVHAFIDTVFGNILDIRECNRRLLEVLRVRQREQQPVIQQIGDVFLTAAAEFRVVYPLYIGQLPVAEKTVKEETESNSEFKNFLEHCSRDPRARRLDLKYFMHRPQEHLTKYSTILETILNDTEKDNADAEYLSEAMQSIRNLHSVAQLRTFQSAMCRGNSAKLEWHNLVSAEFRDGMSKQEVKRQSVIFELIKGEMEYVKDLELLDALFIQPLLNENPPIIPRERVEHWVSRVFSNFADVHLHHRRMLDRLHEIQREEHPIIRSISAPVFDAALNWRDAYMVYIPHYPIAEYTVDEEKANNKEFKAFVERQTRVSDARKHELKMFIHRPVARLPRYELLLRDIMAASPMDHEDRESIPQIIEIISELVRSTNAAIGTAKQKVEIWNYASNLVWKPGEMIDLDLHNEARQLYHFGKLYRQPEGGLDFSKWSEVFVLVFDNYLVITKPRSKDGVTKYHVNRRPIPVDLMNLVGFSDSPQQRPTRLFSIGTKHDAPPNGAGGSGDSAQDSRLIYSFGIHYGGRAGGISQFFIDSSTARTEWRQKLEEAMEMRKVVQDSNKVFELETLSNETFAQPKGYVPSSNWNEDSSMMGGRVTCTVPFSTADGRGLVAIGCAEGVWIGLRHDPKSIRRVLHLKSVTQCAMLEDFGIFLVLADKAFFAYHIEALVPTSPNSQMHSAQNRTPQRLSGNKDVQFFSVGQLAGRTLVVYMKKKGMESVFRVLEPIIGKINEPTRGGGAFSRFGFGVQRSEWFRIYRDFFLPSEAFDLVFLKAKVAILCTKGFEIMDLADFKSVTIPQRDDPRFANIARRCDACRPLGMFRSSENEFLLCYDEFGIYVNRHGDPTRTVGTVVEWEGRAEKVAFHPPYVALFDTRFIEIRHVEKGNLVQIISGEDVRCVWDGRGAKIAPARTPGPGGWDDGTDTQESRIHCVMNTPDVPGQPKSKVQYQIISELVPTVPLFLPEPLSSPSASTYFPRAGSPSLSSPRTSVAGWST
ncbi:Rho1 guanine nucleotide exchange factor 1 [Ceratobasidium sp. AG-Ba]|nr:Rho1 guanine nucleotide exchange factor 1 [Ceratobasidium sp. AG-Ba]QRW02942.1 Rho1 guanine nucleotide exchange factor 1 [Ceratobasidium sp. AG-Ba]